MNIIKNQNIKILKHNWIYLIVVILMLSIGLYAIWNEFSSTSKSHPVSTPATPFSNFNKIITPNVFFFSKIFMQKDNTFVYIPFKFEKDSTYLWLSLTVNNPKHPATRLMFHPQLAKLNWDRIENKELSLYQKQKKYNSIEEFLKKPPESKTILLDRYLNGLYDYSYLHATAFEESIDESKYDYILTTYKPINIKDEIYHFETTIDATDGTVDEKNQLKWMILGPEISEDLPLLLGEIHVDYR